MSGAKSAIERIEWMSSLAGMDLPLSAIRIALALAGHLNSQTGQLNPSFPQLMEDTGLCKRSITYAVNELEAAGLVQVSRSTGRGHTCNFQLILQKKMQEAAPLYGEKMQEVAPLNREKVQASVVKGASQRHKGCNGLLLEHRKNTGRTQVGKKRATSAPAEFLLTENLQQWAGKNAPGIDLKTETEKFLDYHRAKGNTHRDWTAAFRNWLRNAVKFQQQKPEQQSAIPDDPYEAASR